MSSGAEMGNYIVLMFGLLTLIILCHGYEYKVGDLDAWGIPTAANPQVYAKWSKYHNLKKGDSICELVHRIALSLSLSLSLWI